MKKLLVLAWGLLAAGPVFPKVKLPSVLGSNMVLQRECDANLWGWASPSKKVTVTTSWDGRKYATRADADGNWLLKVATPAAGGPYTIRISDGEPVVLENVMVGEVWICSGQSNMGMPVCGYPGDPTERMNELMLEAGKYPSLRLFHVRPEAASEPKDDCDGMGGWQVSSAHSVPGFTATGYIFGRKLCETLNVPVGMIQSDWGGTRIEAWMTVSAAQKLLPNILESDPAYDEQNRTARLYNAMICPLTNFTARGFLWYQGEANRGFDGYARYMQELASLWRGRWGDAEMPFYFVQLAPYTYDDAEGLSLPLTVEQQTQALDLIPFSGMASTTDAGSEHTIHPPYKIRVGERLALLALKRTYGYGALIAQSPRYESVRFEAGRAIVRFRTDGIMGPQWKGPIEGFEIAGADRVFVPAEAEYVPGAPEVTVHSDRVPEPVAVRYAFRNMPRAATLVNSGDLPAYPFRTDDWNDVR